MFWSNSEGMNPAAQTRPVERLDSIDGEQVEQIKVLPNLLGHTGGFMAFITGEAKDEAEALHGLKNREGGKRLVIKAGDGSIAGFAAIEKREGDYVVKIMQGAPEMLSQHVQEIRAYSKEKGQETVFVDADISSTARLLGDSGFSEVASEESGKRAFRSS